VASRKNRTLYYWASFDIHCADIESSAAGILGAVQNFSESAGRSAINTALTPMRESV
jgi:hypothetical protein